jgi:hypothetical protein
MRPFAHPELYRLLNPLGFAARQLAAFEGESEAPLSVSSQNSPCLLNSPAPGSSIQAATIPLIEAMATPPRRKRPLISFRGGGRESNNEDLRHLWSKLAEMRNTRVVLSALGGPEVFQVIEDEIRDPGPNQLRIRVLTSGVSYADVLMRHGMYPGVPPIPYSPGYDIVGVVESCGTGVRQWKSGDLVPALTQTGGYSRYLVLPESAPVRVPHGLDPGKSARWYNIMTEKRKHSEWFREDLSRLLAMLQEKSIDPVIAERLPLRQAARASELLERASVSGKIVLICQE